MMKAFQKPTKVTMLKNRYLTTAEAATLVGFTPDHIRHLIVKGKIKADKIGHTWFISPKSLGKIKRLRNAKAKE